MGDKPEKAPGAWDACTWIGARRDVLELGARLSLYLRKLFHAVRTRVFTKCLDACDDAFLSRLIQLLGNPVDHIREVLSRLTLRDSHHTPPFPGILWVSVHLSAEDKKPLFLSPSVKNLPGRCGY